MSTLAPHDPVPGYPLVFRVDDRVGPDALFWSRVRKALLPKFCGHVFWVVSTSDSITMEGRAVWLNRSLMLQYLPTFVRLSPAEREHIRRYYWRKDKGFVYDRRVLTQLSTAQLVKSGRITTLGWNSYFLSL